MQIQGRFAALPSGRFAIAVAAAALVMVFAVIGLALSSVAPRTARATVLTAAATASTQQAPDAQERNAVLYESRASLWSNQSPDAQERNEQLAR